MILGTRSEASRHVCQIPAGRPPSCYYSAMKMPVVSVDLLIVLVLFNSLLVFKHFTNGVLSSIIQLFSSTSRVEGINPMRSHIADFDEKMNYSSDRKET